MYLFLLLNTVLSQTPSSPQWNPVWMANFTETVVSEAYGNNTVTGTWYYNATLGTSRMDRSSGRYDTFCGKMDWFLFFDTPCTHLVTGGLRYIYYPALSICCMCCTSANGCGMLSPSWLQGASYLGQYNYSTGVQSYLWNQRGNNPNFYWETVDPNPLNRVMLQLDNNGPNDMMIFPTGQQSNYNVSVFNVPTYCQSSILCDATSVCAEVRQSNGDSEYLKDLKG